MNPFAFDLAMECAHTVMAKNVTSSYTVTVIVFVFFATCLSARAAKKRCKIDCNGRKNRMGKFFPADRRISYIDAVTGPGITLKMLTIVWSLRN